MEIVPFDCKLSTCKCPAEVRRESCGIRSDNNGQDEVKIGYTAKANDANGSIVVKRVHPDAKEIRNGTQNCEGGCQAVRTCVVAFEIQAAGRPPIEQGSSMVTKLGDLLLGEKPRLRPYTNRERYTATLKCDSTCTKTTEITVFDGDLIIFCYNFGYNSVPSMGQGTLSMRQFCALLGENGARALVDREILAERRGLKPPLLSGR